MSMKVFVIIFSIVVIVGFVTSCYLITTVNPVPIVTTDKSEPAREFVFDFENTQDNNHFQDVHYGLEKAPSSETPVPLPYLFRKNNPNWLSTQKGSNHRPPNQLALSPDPHVSRTSPMLGPLINTTLPYTCLHVSKNSEVTESPKNNTFNNTNPAKISQPVKGHRRSIDSLQKRFDDISGSVVLKIVDEHGKSRVEIKVNTENRRTFRNKNSPRDNNSELDDAAQDFLISVDELPERTEIRILPNATLVVSDVIEGFHSKLDITTKNSSPKALTNQTNAKHTSNYDFVKGKSHTIPGISRPGSNGPTVAMTVKLSTKQVIQRTTKLVKQLLKNTPTGDLALKVLFDNVTRSFHRET